MRRRRINTERIMKEWYIGRLACPDCSKELQQLQDAIACEQCGFSTPIAKCLDLRPRKCQNRSQNIPSTFSGEEAFVKTRKESPSISYDGPNEGRDSRELLSVIEQLLTTPGCVLDLVAAQRTSSNLLHIWATTMWASTCLALPLISRATPMSCLF